MPIVTVVQIVHAYLKRPRSSVWLVPGSIDDFEDPANEERYPHIDDYLAKRGVVIASKILPCDADRIVAETITKFRQAGIEAVSDTVCDD